MCTLSEAVVGSCGSVSTRILLESALPGSGTSAGSRARLWTPLDLLLRDAQYGGMRTFLVLLGVALLYVGSVVWFEVSIGLRQPEYQGRTLAITTYDADGAGQRRVLSPIQSEGKLYVAANHWPRAWYLRALENPEVQVEIEGASVDYRAVPVDSAERDRLLAEHPMPLRLRFRMGFPPRAFLRLEPRT